MANNNDVVELPETIITPNPEPPEPDRPVWQAWNQKILDLDSLGNLPFSEFDERYITTMTHAMLEAANRIKQGYEISSPAVKAEVESRLVAAGFKLNASFINSSMATLESNLALVKKFIADAEAQVEQQIRLSAPFYPGQDPRKPDAVEAFNYMYRSKQLYGKGVANKSYQAWIASYQAPYALKLLNEQLYNLGYAERNAQQTLDEARKVPMAPVQQASAAPVVMSPIGPLLLAANSLLTLAQAVRAAVASAVLPVATTASVQILAGIALFAYPSSLGDSSRYPVSVPLNDLHSPTDEDLHALAERKGVLSMPVRLGMHFDAQQMTFYAVATGKEAVPAGVRVRAAVYDTTLNRFSFTTDNGQTLLWTPAINPGDASTSLPSEPVAPPDYQGPVIVPVDPYVETFPGVAEGSFDDYVIVFPADSGLDPIYVMFKDRRDMPGRVRGSGSAVVGDWLPHAAVSNGAPVPLAVADKLYKRRFNNFDEFRQAFWIAVTEVPELASQFRKGQLDRMRLGKAPFAPINQQVGGRDKYEIHHVEFISNGGEVYYLNNLRIMSPKRHIDLHSGKGGE